MTPDTASMVTMMASLAKPAMPRTTRKATRPRMHMTIFPLALFIRPEGFIRKRARLSIAPHLVYSTPNAAPSSVTKMVGIMAAPQDSSPLVKVAA